MKEWFIRCETYMTGLYTMHIAMRVHQPIGFIPSQWSAYWKFMSDCFILLQEANTIEVRFERGHLVYLWTYRKP